MSWSCISLFSVFLCVAVAADHDCPMYPSSMWAFEPANLKRQADARAQLLAMTDGRVANGADMPDVRNYIDEHIFGRLRSEGIQSAPLSSNSEFIRRVTIDL